MIKNVYLKIFPFMK